VKINGIQNVRRENEWDVGHSDQIDGIYSRKTINSVIEIHGIQDI